MSATRAQTHVSIDTRDLVASVAFYRALLGAEPVLQRHDYARFDVDDPPLVLGLNSIEARPSTFAGALEHLGIHLPDDAGVDAIRRRMVGSGFALEEEADTECCYARLSRFWATDPSGVRWEVFVTREAVVDAPSRQETASACCEPTCCPSTGT